MVIQLTKSVKRITRKEIAAIGNSNVPLPTKTYVPYCHDEYLNMVFNKFKGHDIHIKNANYQLSHDHTRLFWTGNVEGMHHGDFITMIGGRNSYDKSAAASIALGAMVVVCSNMSLFADLILQHKHTLNVKQQMEALVEQAADDIHEKDKRQLKFFNVLKKTTLNGNHKDILLDAVEERIINSTDLKIVREQYRSPQHLSFKKGTAWALYNAFTSAMKRGFRHQPIVTAARSIKLNDVFIKHIGG